MCFADSTLTDVVSAVRCLFLRRSKQRQTHRKVGTQSHRSKGSFPRTAGLPPLATARVRRTNTLDVTALTSSHADAGFLTVARPHVVDGAHARARVVREHHQQRE